MKYKKLEIGQMDMDKLVEQCLKILTVWQRNTPDKVICLKLGEDGKSAYQIVDVPDGPLVLDE